MLCQGRSRRRTRRPSSLCDSLDVRLDPRIPFLRLYSSETALLYNDRAVLENFHVSAAFKVILEEDANILVNLSKEEYR